MTSHAPPSQRAELLTQEQAAQLDDLMERMKHCSRGNTSYPWLQVTRNEAAALLQHIAAITTDRDAKTKRMWELGHECDRLAAEVAALTQRVEALKRLVLAVDGSGMCGPVCDDVNGRNWFDARQAALSQEPRNG